MERFEAELQAEWSEQRAQMAALRVHLTQRFQQRLLHGLLFNGAVNWACTDTAAVAARRANPDSPLHSPQLSQSSSLISAPSGRRLSTSSVMSSASSSKMSWMTTGTDYSKRFTSTKSAGRLLDSMMKRVGKRILAIDFTERRRMMQQLPEALEPVFKRILVRIVSEFVEPL